jgi:hypothetical protein
VTALRRLAGAVALLCCGCAGVAPAPAPAPPPPVSYPALEFADVRSLAVEVAFAKEEACLVYENMAALDGLTHDLRAVASVERTYSLSSAARTVNKAFAENDPRFDAIPRNKYVLVQALTPIPVSSHLLNPTCDKLWIETTLDRSAVTFKPIGPGLARRQFAPTVVTVLQAELAGAGGKKKPRWRSVTLQQRLAVATLVVRANDGDILTPKALNAVRVATDHLFFLPGTDRSQVKSLLTPDVRWFEVVKGEPFGGTVVDDKSVNSKAELLRRLAISWNGKVLVSPDGASTLVFAPLILVDPVDKRSTLNIPAVAKALEQAVKELQREHGATATFTGLVYVAEPQALACDTREFPCNPVP